MEHDGQIWCDRCGKLVGDDDHGIHTCTPHPVITTVREQLAAVDNENKQLWKNCASLSNQLAATQAEVEALRQKLSEAEADQLSWLTYRHVVDRVEDLEREAVGLRGQLEESRANDRTAMGYLSQVRAIVGGDDFQDMVRRVEALRKVMQQAREALEKCAEDIDNRLSVHESIRSSDDQYEDPEEWRLHPLKTSCQKAITSLRAAIDAAMQPAADSAGK